MNHSIDPTLTTCPRCPASTVVLKDGYGVCPACQTVWQRDELGKLVAVG